MQLREKLRSGLVIPAHPLALNNQRKLDERRQRAVTRYYLAAGAGGIAVGVHTTQFAIRDPKFGLLEPVLALAAEQSRGSDIVKIAGVCGKRRQAAAEAELAARLGYDAVLLNTAVAKAGDPVKMAQAFAKAVEAGRLAFEAGLIEPRDMASPSTPVAGTPFFKIDHAS
jgi:dihydrodipicolinate synthase/N-acetylneuraminate lyase